MLYVIRWTSEDVGRTGEGVIIVTTTGCLVERVSGSRQRLSSALMRAGEMAGVDRKQTVVGQQLNYDLVEAADQGRVACAVEAEVQHPAAGYLRRTERLKVGRRLRRQKKETLDDEI